VLDVDNDLSPVNLKTYFFTLDFLFLVPNTDLLTIALPSKDRDFELTGVFSQGLS